MSKPGTPHDSQKPVKKASSLFGMGVMWVLNVVLVCTTIAVLLAGATLFFMVGRPIAAPDWARDKIEARLAEVLPQTQVRFGEMVLIIEEDWQPRVSLRDVVVQAPDGQEIVRLNELKATFAGAPLLDGEVQPKQVSLSGITAQLDRDASGKVRLSTVGAAPGNRSTSTLGELMSQVDAALAGPALRALESAELRALTLRYEDARAGRAWTVDGGRAVLLRDGDALQLNADLAVLSGGSGVATLSANYSSQIGETAAEFGVSFDDVAAEDIAAQSPAFAWLGVLRAPISGAVRTGLNADGRFRLIAATLQIGEGVVQPNAATDPIPFEGGRSYFNYDPAAKLLTFDELSVRSQWITGQASGTAALNLDDASGQLNTLIGQINLRGLEANPGALYDTPVQLAGVDVDFRLSLDPFKITLGRAEIRDQNQTLSLSGALTAEQEGWQVALDGQMDGIAPRRLLALWPERAIPGTRRWLDANLKAGEVRNIDLALRRKPGSKLQTYVAFDYDKAVVQFLKTLPPAENTRGHFTLSENRLVVSVDEGTLNPPEGGPIKVTGAAFIIPDVTVKQGAPAVVRVESRSSITSALSLINMAPLSVMDKASLPVTLADGEAVLEGTLALQLMRKPTLEYHVSGALLDVQSDVLVKDRRLAGKRLNLTVDNTQLAINGNATLDGVPFDGGWRQTLGPGAGPGRVAGAIPLNTATLNTFGITLPPGSISGTTTGQLEVSLPKGAAPRFSLRSNLRGARVAVPQVSWRKAAESAGIFEVAGRFGTPAVIDTLRVEAPGLQARGSVVLNPNASLERVRFDSLQVGNWLNVPLDLVGRGTGRPVQVVLRGGSLDLRRAEFGPSEGGGASAPMSVRLDRLQISDSIALTGMRGTFETGRGLDGAFEAQLNGQAAVTGRVVPQGGRSAVRLQSADAGAVLRAAGLLKQVVGGKLELLLLPVGSGGAFDGQLTASEVRIKDAPGIAAMLNAVSVVGLVNELNGDGIYFDDVEARFRLTPNRLTLTEASAVGASMGLSMDGTYALDTGQLGMQGVISPVYLLNGIGSLLTRKGEGLIGFNYTLGGTAKKPKVGVNPLSALTPAMFREIFRKPPPELPEVEGVTESTLPRVRPQQRNQVDEIQGDR